MMTDKAQASNDDVLTAVRAYYNFRHPQRYAVMIDGEWGSGKTFLWEKIRDDIQSRGLNDGKNRPLYVSLYGVKDADDISSLLFQQMHPLLASKSVRLVGAILKGALKTAVKVDIDQFDIKDATLAMQLPDSKSGGHTPTIQQRVIVFDDLERAVMSPVEVLGFINPLVEQDGSKVIILCNESAIKTGRVEYDARKEKTVGRTLRITADSESAYPTFLNEIDGPECRSFLERHQISLIDIFRASTKENLRLLKQFMWDFEQLYTRLDIRFRANDTAMIDLARLILALTIELRTGCVTSAVLDYNSVTVLMMRHADKSSPELDQAAAVFKRYPYISFDGGLLPLPLVRDMILRSVMPLKEIESHLSQHPHFVTQRQMPSWRALWYSFEQEFDEIPMIIERFERDLTDVRFKSKLEIKHVIGICLWLSDIGQPGWSNGDVENRLEAYIETVFSGSPAGPDDLGDAPDVRSLGDCAYGLGFKNSTDPRFGRLVRLLNERIAAWKEDGIPLVSAELLSLLRQDCDAFVRSIASTERDQARYARVPVLKAIDPIDFVSVFIRASFQVRRMMITALMIRYEHVQMIPELASEVIPTGLAIDRCPIARPNRAYAVRIRGEKVPSLRARLQNGVVAVPHAGAEFIGAQICPDVLHRVELRRIGRQLHENDVVRDFQIAGAVPPGTIPDQCGHRARGHLRADFGQMLAHPVRVGRGCDQRGTRAAGRADCAEDVGSVVAVVAHHGGA